MLHTQWNRVVLIVMICGFAMSGCVTMNPWASDSEKLVIEVMDVIHKQYIKPISYDPMLISAVKQLERLVGPTGLLKKDGGTMLVLSPQSRKPYRFWSASGEDRSEFITAINDIIGDTANRHRFHSRDDITMEMVKGMVKGLDPEIKLIPPAVFHDFTGEYRIGSVGLNLVMENGTMKVYGIVPDSPAQRADIKIGDKLISIDDMSVKKISEIEIYNKLNGPIGTSVKLSFIDSSNQKEKDITLLREAISNKTIYASIPGPGCGYVWIQRLDQNTSEELKYALESLEAETGILQGLIIDLRNNTGGVLHEAIKISDIFSRTGLICTVQSKDIEPYKFWASSNSLWEKCPLIVLANKGTAAGSEIIVAALSEHKRALFLGTTTYGKGNLDQVSLLRNKWLIKIPSGQMHTPKGDPIQGRGVAPHIAYTGTYPGELIDIAHEVLQKSPEKKFNAMLDTAKKIIKEKNTI